ncbi:MAG: hypothetical protein JWQ59_159 [Cryobacterium sp.]|nr:hypothetical protein [Cryobacterium sp.]
MSIIRWALTFLAFPIGGWIASQLVGPADTPLAAVAAGAIAGAFIGGGQWLAVRRRVSWRWIPTTSLGMALGSALSSAVTSSSTTMTALLVTGAITGAAVGAGQGVLLHRGWRIASAWAASVGLSWAMGWFLTAGVIVDIEFGYIIFGASGALAVVAITGLVLRRVLGPVRRKDARIPSSDGVQVTTALAAHQAAVVR